MGRTKSDEKELVRRAQRGSRKAFEQLVRKYYNLINVLVFCHTHSPEDTRDLVQEVFLSALEGIRELDEEGKFRSWLMQIARAASYNWITRRHDMLSIESVDMEDPKLLDTRGCRHTPHDRATNRETRRWVLRALDSLNPRYKNVILLKYMEGLSYDEIGEILGVSVATIRSRLYRAKSKLQSILRARVPHLEKHWCEQHLALTPEMGDADTDYLDGAGGLLSAL